MASSFNKLVNSYENEGEAGFEDYRERQKNYLEGYYANYRPEIDEQVFAVQMELMMKKVDPRFHPEAFTQMVKGFGNDFEKMARTVFENSFFDNEDQALATISMASGDVLKAIQNDPVYKLYKAFMSVYNEQISPKYNENNIAIDELQQTYMKALLEVFPKKKYYPDANSTMRVSYGRVRGAMPRDAVVYNSKTYLDGVMEKYIPGDYEFDVPAKLRQLHAKETMADTMKMEECQCVSLDQIIPQAATQVVLQSTHMVTSSA